MKNLPRSQGRLRELYEAGWGAKPEDAETEDVQRTESEEDRRD